MISEEHVKKKPETNTSARSWLDQSPSGKRGRTEVHGPDRCSTLGCRVTGGGLKDIFGGTRR